MRNALALMLLADDGCPHDGTAPPRPVVVHTDASWHPRTGRYRAAALTEAGVAPSIASAELLAVRLALRLLRPLPDGTPVEVRCDCLPAVCRLVRPLPAGRCGAETAVARLILADPDWLRLAPAVVWVPRADNEEADALTGPPPARKMRAALALARRAAEEPRTEEPRRPTT